MQERGIEEEIIKEHIRNLEKEELKVEENSKNEQREKIETNKGKINRLEIELEELRIRNNIDINKKKKELEDKLDKAQIELQQILLEQRKAIENYKREETVINLKENTVERKPLVIILREKYDKKFLEIQKIRAAINEIENIKNPSSNYKSDYQEKLDNDPKLIYQVKTNNDSKLIFDDSLKRTN